MQTIVVEKGYRSLYAWGFCLAYSLAFILMGLIVRTQSPMFAAFATYSITASFFLLISFRVLPRLLKECIMNYRLFITINITTLINTLLAYVVLQKISALSYVIVFFGTTPAFLSLIQKAQTRSQYELYTAGLLITSIACGFAVSSTEMHQAAIPIALTLVSSFFGALYMSLSSKLQEKTKMSNANVLAIRFFLTCTVCGLAFQDDISTLLESKQIIYLIIFAAITGSIAPLFLMQAAIKQIGPKEASTIFPIIPIFCLVLSLCGGLLSLTVPLVTATLIFSIFLYLINKSKINADK